MTLVEMHVQLPALPEEETDQYLLRCKGAVVRCEPISRTNSRRKWLLAVYFMELDPVNAELLHRYIERRS